MNPQLDLNSVVMRFLSRVADMVILSVLVLVSCLPILTAGPAVIAGFKVAQNMVYATDSRIVTSFFRYLKDNFKQGFLCTFLLLGMACAIILYLPQEPAAQSPIALTLQTVIATLFFLYSGTLIHFLALIARYDNTLMQHAVNALYLTLSDLLRCVSVLIVAGLPLIFFLLLPESGFYLIPFWVFFYPGLSLYLLNRILKSSFSKLENLNHTNNS